VPDDLHGRSRKAEAVLDPPLRSPGGCPRASAVGHARPEPSSTSPFHSRTGARELPRSVMSGRSPTRRHTSTTGRVPDSIRGLSQMAEARRNVVHRPADVVRVTQRSAPRDRSRAGRHAVTLERVPPIPLIRNAANERPETWEWCSDSSLASPRPKPKRRSLGAVEPAPEAVWLPATGALGSVTCSSKPLCSSCGQRTPDDRTQRHDVAIMELTILTATPALPEEGRHDRPG